MIENEARTAHQEQNNHALKSFDKRVVFVRVVFVLCGILTIIASILFYTEGVTAFKSSIDAMTRGIDVSEAQLCYLLSDHTRLLKVFYLSYNK